MYRVPANRTNLQASALFIQLRRRRQANVPCTWNAPSPADIVHLLSTMEAPRSGAEDLDAIYRRLANRLNLPKKSRRQASVAHTWIVPGPAPIVYLLSTTEAPRSGADKLRGYVSTSRERLNSSKKTAGRPTRPVPSMRRVPRPTTFNIMIAVSWRRRAAAPTSPTRRITVPRAVYPVGGPPAGTSCFAFNRPPSSPPSNQRFKFPASRERADGLNVHRSVLPSLPSLELAARQHPSCGILALAPDLLHPISAAATPIFVAFDLRQVRAEHSMSDYNPQFNPGPLPHVWLNYLKPHPKFKEYPYLNSTTGLAISGMSNLETTIRRASTSRSKAGTKLVLPALTKQAATRYSVLRGKKFKRWSSEVGELDGREHNGFVLMRM
ncbi:hypothetical protein DFH06DRAFT_1141993 [Mycena polygramma]|nr:hypothetical protein DFH06DRAFT_1141993 [Mycena polygramma]